MEHGPPVEKAGSHRTADGEPLREGAFMVSGRRRPESKAQGSNPLDTSAGMELTERTPCAATRCLLDPSATGILAKPPGKGDAR